MILIAFSKVIFKHFQEYFRMIKLVDKIPGPKAYPIVGCALRFSPDNEKSTYQMEREFRTFTEYSDAPGLMRLWLGPKPIILVYKPETIRVILESQSLITKPMEYSHLKDWLGEGLLTRWVKKWLDRGQGATVSIALLDSRPDNKESEIYRVHIGSKSRVENLPGWDPKNL